MENNNVKMSSPWIQYVHMLEAMFGEDKEIKIKYDEDNTTVKLFVENTTKAEALAEILPENVAFGNMTLTILVVPSNFSKTTEELFKNAFAGNPALRDTIVVEGAFSNSMTYLMFRKDVVQYFDDNLGDPHGNRSTLFQDIASKLFKKMDGVFYCTDTIDSVF